MSTMQHGMADFARKAPMESVLQHSGTRKPRRLCKGLAHRTCNKSCSAGDGRQCGSVGWQVREAGKQEWQGSQSCGNLMQMAERGIGFVGDITSIKPDLISTLVEGGYIPVVASVAADYDGQALNVNADIAAGEVSKLSAHAGLMLKAL